MKKFKILLLFTSFILLFGCAKDEEKSDELKILKEPISKNEFLLDTLCTITLYQGDEKLLDDSFNYIRKYENLLSRTVKGSDVYNLNNSDGKAVKISPETMEVIKSGLHYSDLTNGKFDISIEPISSLWNFDNDDSKIPDKSDLDKLLPNINYKDIEIIDDHTVKLKSPEQGIDLGAIAKGYIADELKSYLEKKGVKHAVIDLGGNVLCIGVKPNGEKFKVGIQDPFNKRNKVYGIVDIDDKSVVSSGIYERFIEKDGKRYHHILNPKTGMPYDNGLEQVTIISEKSIDGDGLSTSAFALGVEEGIKLINTIDDVDAIFITEDGKIHKTEGIDSKYNFREYKKD
ncbi:MAG: FAD:protein FMN transferase [Andreesenia angusta]|nr:FAD:protein FMN transferase [Andreesenia angusta]